MAIWYILPPLLYQEKSGNPNPLPTYGMHAIVKWQTRANPTSDVFAITTLELQKAKAFLKVEENFLFVFKTY
jgi:hypothetical protein